MRGHSASAIFLSLLVGCLLGGCSNSPPGGANTPRQESTEDKLRRVYDSQGIKYDDRTIREDARAIEKLNREFGK